jgi:U3 small nucleolar RNA-associated protein 20
VETLLEAERTPENLSSFKTKLNLLQRVDYERVAPTLKHNAALARVPLNYLLGVLYTNFTLLWEPVARLVAGYGNGMPRDAFWPTFGGQLRRASADVRDQLSAIRRGEWVRHPDASRRVDWINYRNQLWGVMGRFAGVAESKNRELVAVFLDQFMAKEYITIRYAWVL